jgi:hypothetical protein
MALNTHGCLTLNYPAYEFRIKRASRVLVFEARGYLSDILLCLLLRAHVFVEVREVLVNLHSFSLGYELLAGLLSLCLRSLFDLRRKLSYFC